MKITNMIAKFLPAVEEVKPSTGKKVLKAVLVAGAVIAFVPTVFKINEGEGFEGYGLLSTLKYEKKPKEDGGYDVNVTYDLIDLDRLGIKKSSDEADESEVIETDAVEVCEEAVL